LCCVFFFVILEKYALSAHKTHAHSSAELLFLSVPSFLRFFFHFEWAFAGERSGGKKHLIREHTGISGNVFREDDHASHMKYSINFTTKLFKAQNCTIFLSFFSSFLARLPVAGRYLLIRKRQIRSVRRLKEEEN
jgi:hypothetical protein